MKKLIALTLVLCLLCGCCVSALADQGFVMLYNLVTDDSGEYDFTLGKPDGNIEGDPGAFTMFIYDTEQNQVMLAGKDATGSTRIVWWENVDFAQGIWTIYSFCAVYGEIAEMLDSDQTLAFGMVGGDDPIYILSTTEAANFRTAVEETLNK